MKNKIKNHLKQSGHTLKEVADALGISRQWLYHKLNNPGQFRIEEMGILSMEFGIHIVGINEVQFGG